jgi:elongation factor G
LFNVTRNQKEKLSKLLLFYASHPEEVETLTFGDVGVILGLKHTRTGDTLIATGSQYVGRSKHHQLAHSEWTTLDGIKPPPAVMSSSIIPQSTADLQPVTDALNALARTDPSARVEVAEGQLLVHGLGSLHLEIIESRLRDEWGVAFETGPRRVTYRETLDLDKEISHSEVWDADIHGRSVEVKIDMEIRSLGPDEEGDAHWDDNIVLNDEDVPLSAPGLDTNNTVRDSRDPWAFIAQGISSSLLASPHSGLPYSRTCIKILGYGLKPEDGASSVLAGGASFALRHALQQSGRGPLMEPYVRLRVSVGEEHIGRVVKDITEHGGEILDLGNQSSGSFSDEESIPFSEDGVYIPPQWMSPSSGLGGGGETGLHMKRTILSLAPLSRMLDFNSRLRALSGGHGTFEMSSVGCRTVNKARESEILKELGRA